jgi:hypothetical protein
MFKIKLADMKLHYSKIIFALLIALLATSPLAAAVAYNSSTALNYLQSNSSNPWSTMAQAALGASGISSDYLKTISGTDAISYEAPILAITSLNQNPKTFGSTDYTAKLESYRTSGQMGDPALLNDDIFGILALASSGIPVTDSAISDSKNFLLAHQNSDGGWSYNVGGTSDSNTTASAITALVTAGISSSDSHIQNALNYLHTAQNSDGGFTYDPTGSFGTSSDSSSTAWVMWALNSLGISAFSWTKSGNTPDSYLESNQTSSGLFQFQAGSGQDSMSPATTAYAVIALSGKTLPIRILNPDAQSQSFGFRIEGSNDTVCSGQALGPTALDIVKNAAAQCGYAYNIQSTSYGPYLNQIATDTASGNNGWVYLVNNTEPNIGAADYNLKTGDDVLWFFGDYAWLPAKISLSGSQTASGQSVTATVQDYDNGAWSPLSGATVTAGTKTFTTDNNGQVNITNQDGYYQIFASKTGYIRSNSILLQIGQPSSGQISLTANIVGGQILGTSTQPNTIAFSVSPASLDFGTLSANLGISKQITISNTGGVNINVKAVVSGDSLFTDNLSVGNTFWKNFSVEIGTQQNQNETVSLKLPSGYAKSSGQKTGQLIFWATGQ